mgnify:CR=1 FL=1
MDLKKIPISKIKPYENNARKNDIAVDTVVKSIQQCEYVAPIVVDENNVILAGHTRWKALKQLGYQEVECVVKTGLTDEQKKKYRLLDNKTAEIAEWDFEILAKELDELDFNDLDLDWGIEASFEENLIHEDEEGTEVKELPYSKIYIFCISAFGMQSECFTELQLEETTAEKLIQKIKDVGAIEITKKIKGVLDEI